MASPAPLSSTPSSSRSLSAERSSPSAPQSSTSKAFTRPCLGLTVCDDPQRYSHTCFCLTRSCRALDFDQFVAYHSASVHSKYKGGSFHFTKRFEGAGQVRDERSMILPF